MLQATSVRCPYCDAAFEALLDPSEAGDSYIQDCAVCCQPIRFLLALGDDGAVGVELQAEQD